MMAKTVSAAIVVFCLTNLSITAGPMAVLNSPADWKAWNTSGNWRWDGEWVGGEGSNSWQYAEQGKPSWKDYRVDLALRIDTATQRRDPKWEDSCFHAYNNSVEIAGHEAGIALRRQSNHFYRVMFSAPFQEVMLWSTKGGFLQVIPFAFETGRVYQLSAVAQGPHITVGIDGKPVIDYWDRTAPILSGGVALGIHEGVAFFGKVSITKLRRSRETAPPHKADFRFRDWKGTKWAWDGNEPIFFLPGDSNGHEVKLVPGYKPQVLMFWHWLNYADESFYADKVKALTVKEEGSRLRFEIVSVDKDKTWLTSRCDIALSYEPDRNRYIYDHVSELTIPEGHSLRFNHPIEYTDPCVNGHVGSASTYGNQWETPHPWSVYKHVSGKLYKHPHNHYVWYPGYGYPEWQAAKGNFLDPNGGFWAVVGDPVANPVFEIQGSSVKDSEFYTELCGWAFDVHMRWFPVKAGTTLAAGKHTVNWRLTSVDGKQADAWLAEATFCAPGDLEKKVLLYTGGIGHVERFDKVVKWASPFYEHPWGDASLQDITVGHTDKTSMKLMGPRSATTVVGASQFSEPVLENTDYEVSAWVKTKDVQGEGPGIRFGGQSYFPVVIGSTDWQKIGFVCRPGQPLHTVSIALLNSGAGTVWFDDFMIRPLQKDEKPAPPIAPEPKPVVATNAVPGEVLKWNGKSDAADIGRTLLDLSNHGNHGRMEGTIALVDDSGKRVLDLNGNTGHVTTDSSLSFKPPQTFAIWVKPGAFTNDWSMIATGGQWNRAWVLFLFCKQSPYSVDFRPWGKRMFVDSVAPKDKWTHLAFVEDGKAIRIYVNGARAKEEQIGGSDWAVIEGPLVLGTWLYYDQPKSSYIGRLAGCAYWNKALSDAEVKALFDQGPM